MAEFCKKCADSLGVEPDLTIQQLGIEPGCYMYTLCEGCTTIFILNDDGKEVVFRPDSPVVK